MKKRLKFLLRYRRIISILTHTFLFTVAYLFAYLLRFDFNIPLDMQSTLYQALPLIIGIQLMTFCLLGLFHGLWHYIAVEDLLLLIKANALATMIMVAVVRLLGWNSLPRSVFIIDFVLALAFTAGLRLALRLLKEYLSKRKLPASKDNTILIVGAGEAGVMLLKEIGRNPSMGRVVGFIDDDIVKQQATIQGKKILGYRHDIPKIVSRYEVDEIILAIPSSDGKTVRSILGYCEQTKAKIKVIPGLSQILSGKMELKPRAVQPEDLLGRETVKINEDEVKHYIQDRVVLVTGAGGSIGSEIGRQVASFGPKELLLFDHHENYVYFLSLELKNKYPNLVIHTIIGDVRDVGLLKHLFSSRRPQVVFHAAAHKHVPLMEDCPVAAVKNNIFGSRNLIYASSHYKVERFVLISTDKAVNPINTMGMSKRVAEMILQAKSVRAKTKFMAVRFGNVLGSAGSVVPLFKRQIESGGPVTVTHPDVKRYFMSIKEAVMLVLQAGALGKGGELFILDMGEQIKVIEIAKNLIALSGLTVGKDIEIKYTGLRPGEKMEEELLLDKEKDVVTNHDKIFVSHSGDAYDRAVLQRDLRKLHRMSQMMNEAEILPLLNEIVTAGNR